MKSFFLKIRTGAAANYIFVAWFIFRMRSYQQQFKFVTLRQDIRC